jgi:AraC family transcriptional regulator
MALDESPISHQAVLSVPAVDSGSMFQWQNQVNEVFDAVRHVLDNAREPAETRIERAGALLRQHPMNRHRREGNAQVQDNASHRGLLRWHMRRITAYVDSNLTETIHIADLASLINLSTSHFCRKFRASENESPHNFILRKRIERATTLMTTTRFALRHIATDCGLCDQAHFCKIFKKIVGQTPSEWRRNWQSEQQLSGTSA